MFRLCVLTAMLATNAAVHTLAAVQPKTPAEEGLATVYVAAMSADGKLFAGWRKERPGLWNVEGKLVQELPEEFLPLYERSLAELFHSQKAKRMVEKIPVFSPSGKLLASSSVDNKLARVWDVAQGKVTATFELDNPLSLNLAFSQDEKTLIVARFDARVELWDLATGTKNHTFSVRHRHQYLYALAVSPDGKRIVTGGLGIGAGETGIGIWDFPTGKEVKRLDHGRHVAQLAHSPNGRILASVDRGKEGVRLWDADSYAPLCSCQAREGTTLRDSCRLSFSPDSRLLAFASDSTIIWETATGGSLDRARELAHQVFFLPDSRVLLSRRPGTEGGGRTRILDLHTLLPRPAKADLKQEQLTSVWKALSGADARLARDTVDRCAGSPAVSIPFLAKRLTTDTADQKQLAWIPT